MLSSFRGTSFPGPLPGALPLDPMGATPSDPDYRLRGGRALGPRYRPPEGIRMHQIRSAPGLRPAPRSGSHDAPQTPSRMGRGTFPPHTRPPRRIRRLCLDAFGISISVPSMPVGLPQLIFRSRAPARVYLVLFPR